MNILHFDMNVPKQVTLASPQGTTIEGRYGNRVMFHLGNGQVMYVPPVVGGTTAADRLAAQAR